MTHYNEYSELFEEWTPSQLERAHVALTNEELQEELYVEENPLLVFLIDTYKQEQLCLYFEDLREEEEEEEYD